MDNLIRNSATTRQVQGEAPPGFQIHRQQSKTAMFLPTNLVKQMQDEAFRQEFDEAADEVETPLEASIPEPAPVAATSRVPIFKRESIDRAIQELKATDDEKFGHNILPTLEEAKREDGYRRTLSGKVTLTHIRDHLQNVVSEMPNLALAADALAAELALAVSSPSNEFRVTPMLLHGAPGIGKTRFVSQLAALLGVGFDKVFVLVINPASVEFRVQRVVGVGLVRTDHRSLLHECVGQRGHVGLIFVLQHEGQGFVGASAFACQFGAFLAHNEYTAFARLLMFCQAAINPIHFFVLRTDVPIYISTVEMNFT